jgi:glucosamine--fructose-6-phosphate aminotransferase (isomerizing)
MEMEDDFFMSAATKAGAHTLGEILSQPETWSRCLAALESSNQLQQLSDSLPNNIEWVFIGCGSSFFLSEVAAASWAFLTGERSRALPASELLLFPQLLPGNYQPVLISRSGQTSEVIEAARHLRDDPALQILGITCGEQTPLEALCHYIIRLPEADEKSTVMTQSFTSMLLALQCLAATRAGSKPFNALRTLPSTSEKKLPALQSVIQSVVASRKFADYVFLGQGPFFGIAQEAMLKVKEMSCSYAQSFHTLEFRHGPKAIVSPETLLTFFLSESGMESEFAVLEEMRQLGGTILAVANSPGARVRKNSDFCIALELDVPEIFRPAGAIVAGQLLGYYTGLSKGFDPDHPRNLTRVVMLQGANDGGSSRES